MNWWAVGALGVITLGLFVWLLAKVDWKFDASFLGLFIFGVSVLSIAIIQPTSFKYNGFEMVKEYAENAKRSEELADQYKKQAEKASKLAMESLAMLTWNQGRYGGMDESTKKPIIDGILNDLWGEKAGQYKNYMKKRGVYLIPENEREQIPETDFPSGIDSPFYQRFLEKEGKK